MTPAALLSILARATTQRLWQRRERGITPYYVEGFPNRIESAAWQLRRCPGSTVLEIGCGRDLHAALVAALRFGKRVIAWDVAPLADLALVNYTARRLGHPTAFAALDELERIGVRYVVAPDPAVIAGYDAVVSTAVLEHLPANQVDALFAAAARAGAQVITADIDFADHWSYLARVGPDNFYYVSDLLWAWINTPRMHQNRMRFSDIDGLARQHGFALAEVERSLLTTPIDTRRLNRRFSGYCLEDLATRRVLVQWRRA